MKKPLSIRVFHGSSRLHATKPKPSWEALWSDRASDFIVAESRQVVLPRRFESCPNLIAALPPASTTRRNFAWSNTHHLEGDLTRAVNALKKAAPRGLLVGGPKLSAALQQLDLVDEYRFVVHPVVAGHGPFLFSGLQPSLRLKLVAATRLKSGIVALHYRRRQ